VQHGEALNLMRAAWKVETAEGEKRSSNSRFLERDHESEARAPVDSWRVVQVSGDHQHY
jgi:hypothetical protein